MTDPRLQSPARLAEIAAAGCQSALNRDQDAQMDWWRLFKTSADVIMGRRTFERGYAAGYSAVPELLAMVAALEERLLAAERILKATQLHPYVPDGASIARYFND